MDLVGSIATLFKIGSLIYHDFGVGGLYWAFSVFIGQYLGNSEDLRYLWLILFQGQLNFSLTECDISSQDFSVSRIFSFCQYQSQSQKNRSQKSLRISVKKIWSKTKSRYRSGTFWSQKRLSIVLERFGLKKSWYWSQKFGLEKIWYFTYFKIESEIYYSYKF